MDKDGNTNLLPKTLYTTILYIIMRGLSKMTKLKFGDVEFEMWLANSDKESNGYLEAYQGNLYHTGSGII